MAAIAAARPVGRPDPGWEANAPDGPIGTVASMTTGDVRRRARIAAGLAATAAGLALIGSSFLGWITTPMHGGGRTAISGWGSISGGNELVDGVNLNTLMAGIGSYRPAVPVVLLGAVTVIPGLILAVNTRRRLSRTMGALLGALGVAAALWAAIKVVAPGDAVGVLPDGQGSAGAGPVVALIAGLVIVAASAVALLGWLDPPLPVARRGVQPGR